MTTLFKDVAGVLPHELGNDRFPLHGTGVAAVKEHQRGAGAFLLVDEGDAPYGDSFDRHGWLHGKVRGHYARESPASMSAGWGMRKGR
ncbi:MAG TPA: hypothetical protein PKD27_04035, partial [Tepidiformaceae bacterium]|nr:hypothetical protein [Tepidiformaceae bacterium]